MKQAYAFCLAFCILLPGLAKAQAPDWSTSVASILYNNCTKCHNSSGIAPFAIESYQDAVNYSSFIPNYINNRLMPPWPPDPAYRHFVNERVLTQGQIDTINAWINGGTPLGDSSLAPPVPHFNNGIMLGTPDMVLQIPTYTSTATTSDDYACFVLPLNIPEDKYVKAIQILPGNPKIVHHAIVMIDTLASMTNQDCMIALANLPGSNSAITLTSYAAGMGPTVFPSGEGGLKMGERLKKGSNIMVQIHYPVGTAGQVDSTKILFYLYSDSAAAAPNPPLRTLTVGLYTMNWGIYIPANTVQTYTATYPGPYTITYTGSATATAGNYSLFAVDPHMHLIGRQMTSWGLTPAHDTIPFERVPNWQFNWQAYYFFNNLIKLDSGSVIEATAEYDNTTNNLYNPNSPPQAIVAGENTSNEMMLVAFMYMPYEQGDENYNLDSLVNLAIAGYQVSTGINTVTAPGNLGFSVYPNPSSGQFVLTAFNLDEKPVEIAVTNLLGQTLITKNYDNLSGPAELNANGLPEGVYLVRLRQNNLSVTKKIVVAGR